MSAVIAVPSTHGPFFFDGAESGFFAVEAFKPYNILIENGYSVQIVSETGEAAPDPSSLTEEHFTKDELEQAKSPNSPFNLALKQIKKAADVDPKKFTIFYAVGGQPAPLDYPGATNLHHLASEIYKNGGVVSSVCFGCTILPYIKAPDGESVVKGKEVTWYESKEEIESWLHYIGEQYRSKYLDNLVNTSTLAKNLGATTTQPKGGDDEDLTIVQGRLVSGANPKSTVSSITAVIKVDRAS
jgi:putative intracellular protease/amidase